MPSELTAKRSATLRALVVDHLRTAELKAPQASEGETGFTRRVLQPSMRARLGQVAFPGLLLTGDGAASVQSAFVLGLHFYPDIGISYFGRSVLAIEVKLLRGSSRQNSLATAVGQASMYKIAGYENVGIMLIDVMGRCSDLEILEAAVELSESGLDLVVRRSGHGLLARHPSDSG